MGVTTQKRARSRAGLAPFSPNASHEEVRGYLQQRLTLFCKVWFWCFWILLGFAAVLYQGWPEIEPARIAVVYGASIPGILALGAIAYGPLTWKKLPIRILYFLDGLFASVVGMILAITAYFQSELIPAVYSAVIWHTFWVFSRVLILPSTARRTAIITVVSLVPFTAAGVAMALTVPQQLGMPAAAFLGGELIFFAVAVTLSTIGSRVMYGLRQQASEARQLGQYTLDAKIGEGGMGAVYRARHAMLRRPTAIKLLPPEKYGEAALRRFEREVQHTSLLTHPNTVAIFDYGKSPDGVFYYAMEFLDGIDLQRLVARDGAQAAPRVIRILRQVCGALDEAHALGLTHRDIKPGNIILCQRGRIPDIAKVFDFGLVKELTRDGADTATKMIAGTPEYLAPEGVADPDRVGPASDLYSLGAVGYFLLTGKKVFEGKSALDFCVQHATKQPVPPSQRTDNPIPADLEALILSCLAKNPTDRPHSADAMRLALGRMPAAADWDQARAAEWWRDFDARRKQRDAAAADDSEPPITITIDIAARVDSPDD